MNHLDPGEARAKAPENLPPPPERRSLRSQLLRAFVLVASVPVVILGVVSVFDQLRSDRSQLLVHVLWVVTAVSLSFLLARVLAERVTRPLEGMVQRVRELSINGSTLEPPIPATAPAEVGDLAEVAEEMALGFHESYAQLQRAVTEREDLHTRMQAALRDAEREARKSAVQEVEEHLARLSQAKDVAEAASRFKSALLASTSHEIRTPMSGIVGMVELLLKSPLNDRQRQYAEAINHSAEALLGVVDDLLDLAKIEAGKLTLKDVDYSPREVAQQVVGILEPRARGKDLELTVEVGPEVPAWLRGDAGRLRQVLLNLVGNALKFTEAGKVCLVLERAAEGLSFAVQDTGIGIAESDQENIFQPFSQAANGSSRRSGGTGLGLAISRQLVELMGGEIGMRSALGDGSTFFFQIPIRLGKAPSYSPEAASATRGADLEPRDAPQGRILVVEDNKINQLVISQMLKSLGYPHDIAEHGLEALSFLERESYALVLMDCQMPQLNGYETTQRIRAAESDGEHLTIVALTAHATHGEREKCLAAGMDDYLTKPLRQKQLVSTLDRWLSGG